ncbi:MAG: AzlD domain-containing protein [Anaerolineae bacterium]|nr:AzlD domain-containing protein [Anaerolineae bacterium]
MNEPLLILGMVLVTFGVRYPVLAVVGKIKLPEPVFRALRFVPPAVLTAIIAPAVLMPEDNQLLLSPANAYLVAGVVAGLVSWRSRSLLLTIVVGMVVFLGWRAVFGAM